MTEKIIEIVIVAAPVTRVTLLRTENGGVTAAAEYNVITDKDTIYQQSIMALEVSGDFAEMVKAGWAAAQGQVNIAEELK